MKINTSKTLAIVLLATLGVLSFPSYAATSVGKAIISIGKVVSKNADGVENKLKRRGKVFEGDTITVGKKSRLQLRFVDNQLVVLKENTIFRIDEYKFKDKNDQNKSAALSLLKGGMRSVTGLIGKSARDKYKVKTPVATMGVRGTHYVIQLCSGNCGPGVQGIVGTVLQGAIVMTNDTGTQQFGTDQFFNVPSMNEAPRTITNPPSILISRATTTADDDGTTTTTTDDGTTTTITTTTDDGTTTTVTFSSTEQGTITTTAGTVSTASAPQTFIAGTPAPFGAVLIGAGISPGVDGAGGGVAIQGFTGPDVIGIATVNMVGNQPVYGSFVDQMGTADYAVLDGAVAINPNGNAMLGVNWGRWASNDIVFKEDGVDSSLLTGLDFIYSDNLTPSLSALIGLGTQTYNLTGGPGFRDGAGNALTPDMMSPLQVIVSFSAQEISSFTGVLNGIDMRSYSFNTTMPVSFVDLAMGVQLDLVGMCTGGTCSSGISLMGTAGGEFLGTNAEGYIGYLGLGDGIGTTNSVSGAGVFER